jgi:hypothetical protein
MPNGADRERNNGMRTKRLAFGLGLAILLATVLPALGGVGAASAHVGHRSCGDFGSEGVAALASAGPLFEGDRPGVGNPGVSEIATVGPNEFSNFVEFNHTIGWEDFYGIEFGPCEPAP